MSKPQAPCLMCDHKEIGCHSNCEKYKAFVDINDKWKKDIREAKEKERAYVDVRKVHKKGVYKNGR